MSGPRGALQAPYFDVSRLAHIALTALLGATPMLAHAQLTIPEEYGKTVKAAESVRTLGADLFGDQVGLYAGDTTFSTTDVSVPGNNALAVAVGRRFRVESRDSYERSKWLGRDGMFADWDLGKV